MSNFTSEEYRIMINALKVKANGFRTKARRAEINLKGLEQVNMLKKDFEAKILNDINNYHEEILKIEALILKVEGMMNND